MFLPSSIILIDLHLAEEATEKPSLGLKKTEKPREKFKGCFNHHWLPSSLLFLLQPRSLHLKKRYKFVAI
jgi:hypothetical protein